MKRLLTVAILLLAVATARPAAAATHPSQSSNSGNATARAAAPTITSDQPDYHPGEVVTLKGTGWAPNEVVTIVMSVVPATHEPVTLFSKSDARGNFENSEYAVQSSDHNVKFFVKATGATADTSPVLTFTDAIGAPTSIGIKDVSGTASTTLAITVSAAVPVNNTVLVALVFQDTNNPTVTVTDTAANTYTNNADVTDSGTNRTIVFSAPVTTALAVNGTITMHFSASTSYISASAFQVSGLILVSNVDQTATASGTAAAMSSGTAATTTQAGQLLFGAFGSYVNGTPTFTPETGWTALTNEVVLLGIYPEYRIVTATGAYAATGTLSSKPNDWGAAIVTYQGAASQLAFSTTPVTVAAGVCSPVITVQSQDSNGSAAPPASTTETIALSTSGGGGSFYSNSTCTTAITSVTILNSATAASFYWRDTVGGSSPVITASGTGSFTSAPTQTETVTNNPVPAITTLSPTSATAGAASQPLTINGSNFLTTSTVTYNNVSHTATYVSAAQLTITLTTGDQATAGTYAVVVTNPAPGGGASNSVNFTVNNLVPTITTLSPTTLPAGSASQALTINGTNFLSTSTATYNNVAHAVTYTSSAVVSITLTTGDLATAGSYPVVVTNPTPGGGPSNSVNFIVSGAAAKLAFSQQPTTAVAGASISPAPSVLVEDSNGNLVTNSTASVTLAIGTNPGSGTLSGTATVNAVAGVATFTGLSINKTGTGYTLTAASTGLTGTTSSAFNITPGTATQLVFTTEPGGTATGGTAFSPQPVVTVEDVNGNTVTSNTASITLAIGTNPSSGTLTCTTNPLAASAGVATFAGCSINFTGTGYTLTAAATGLTGATSTPINVSAGAANKLLFVQQPTSTTDGSSITPAVTVSVTDAGGNVVLTSSASIAMAIGTNPGGGTLTGTTPVNAVNGVATFSNLSINKTGTGYTLSATSSGLATATSGAFNITPGAPTQLVFTTQPSASSVAATAFAAQPVVKVEDANGNVVTTGTGSTDSIALAIGTNPGGGTLSCTSNTVTAVAGVATFAACKVNKTGTGYTLTATDGTNTLPVATSSAFTITPGTATQLIFTTEPSATATGGAAFAQQPVVSVEDANNNVVTTSAASVTLAINTGTGALACTTNPVTASSGVATFAGCNLTLAGSYTLKATATGLTTAISTTIVVSVGTEAKLVFTTQPASTTAGTAFTVAVSVEDAGGNVVTTSTDSIALAIGTNPGSSTLSGTTPVNAVNGVATFSGMSLNKTGTGYTLTATDSTTAITAATSSAFNITASTATQLIFTTEPSGSANAGTAFATQPTVTVEDASGNTVTTSTASITLSLTVAGGATLTCTANPKSATAGVDTFAGCSINLGGTYTLTASGTGLTSAVSTSIAILGPPTITKAFNPTSISSGGTSTVTLTLSNPNTSTTLTSVNVSDTLPTNMTIASPTNESSTCSGATLAGGSGTGLFTETGASIPASSSCTAQFNVTVSAGGSFVNTTGAVSSSNGGTGGTATATLGVQAAPAITSAASTTFFLNTAGSFQVTATGNPTPTFSETGSLPAGVTFSSSGLLSGTATAAGSFTFSIDATNGVSPDSIQSFTLTVSSVSTYTEPFNSGHGWTYLQSSCGTGTCSNSATENSTDCGPGGVGTLCVEATNEGGIINAGAMQGYFHNPTGYTWQTLGVPANVSVTSVQGAFYDRSPDSCNSASVGLQIFDASGSPEITTPSVYANISVTGDTGGVTHTGSTVSVTGDNASSSSISIHFNIYPSGTAFFGTCEVYGDNINLVITYASGSGGHRRRGQVIIGMNRQSDGKMHEAWAYNVDLLDPATAPLTLEDLKFTPSGKSGIALDPTNIPDERMRVTPINLTQD
jgi:hypothetical protein